MLTKFFEPRDNFWRKKNRKKVVWGIFWKILTIHQSKYILAPKTSLENFYSQSAKNRYTGAELGGRGGGFPLCTILRYPVLATDPKNFLKEPLARIYSEGGGGGGGFCARRKNDIFWPKFSKKCLKMFSPFSKNLPAAPKSFSNYGLYSGLRELRKSTWST